MKKSIKPKFSKEFEFFKFINNLTSVLILFKLKKNLSEIIGYFLSEI